MGFIRADYAAGCRRTHLRNNLLLCLNRTAQSSIAASRRRLIANGILSGVLILFGSVQSGAQPLKTAVFYGAPMPVAALAHYDRVVVEADNFPAPPVFPASTPQVFAYVSVGEAEGWRTSASSLDEKLFLGTNQGWNSRIADLTQRGWSDYLIETRMRALWDQGYRAFFLDTLDSYRIVVKDPDGQLRQTDALVNIIHSIHRRFPGVRLLLNRGFEILPEVAHLAVGVVAESLFQGWDAGTGTYVLVNEDGRNWLLAQLRTANIRYRLPVTVIDYVAPDQPDLARDTARRIRALGFSAWVATPSLNTLSAEPE